MTTTATHGYTLPVVGADFNSWGTELNGNFSIIDNNLGGINSNSMAASSGGTYTVTSAAAQNVIQQMTGTITGNVTYQMPAQQGFWILDNNTTGAFDVIVTSTGAGTSVTAPPGGTMLIWSDATNIMTFGRTILGQTLNLYVATTGSDSNNGYTSANAFLTLQHAANVAQNNYDTQGNNIVINVANGTYTAGLAQVGPLMGGGILQFTGNTTTPSSCAITMGAATGACFLAQAQARINVSGFQLTQTHGTNNTNPGSGFSSSLGGIIIADHITFGACQYAHIASGSGGYFQMTTAHTIAGNAQFHMVSGGAGGQIVAINLTSPSVTLSGTPAFTAFLYADAGIVNVSGTTWSGSATGLKLTLADGGVIFAGGAQASLPGTSNTGVQINQGGFIS